MGNLRSVSKALERVGGDPKVTSSVTDIEKAEALILPGVGAFYQAMENLKSLGMVTPLCQAIYSGKPFLGICLGLQLLFAESEEGNCAGLNIIPGKVKKFRVESLKLKDDKDKNSQLSLKVPHMGWNGVQFKEESLESKDNKSKNSPFLQEIPQGSYFYFAHSYYVEPADEKAILMMTEYGMKFTSAVRKDNIFGVQFHPEKSGEKGLKLLENFVLMSRIK